MRLIAAIALIALMAASVPEASLSAAEGAAPSGGPSVTPAAPRSTQPVAPAGAPPTMPLDAATARRAEKAAQEYLDHEEANKVPASADALTALADAELLLLETKTLLDQGDAMKAGERYLDAGKKLLGVPVDQRAKLGERYRKASAQLTALSTALLAQDVYNPLDETRTDPSHATGQAIAPRSEAPPATAPAEILER